MTENERLLRRQAEWQHQRRTLSWPEKIRQAEELRSTIEAFKVQRQRLQGRPKMPSPSGFPPPDTQ